MIDSGFGSMRKSLFSAVGAFVVIAFTSGLVAAVASAAPPYRVAIDVRAPDSIRAKLTNCLAEGLRSLEDVRVVTDDPLFGINVVAVDFEVGHALSVVATQPTRQTLPMRVLGQLVNAPDAAEIAAIQAIRELTPALEAGTSLLGHSVLTGASSQLEEHCQAIVAGFDDNYLKVYRAAGQ